MTQQPPPTNNGLGLGFGLTAAAVAAILLAVVIIVACCGGLAILPLLDAEGAA